MKAAQFDPKTGKVGINDIAKPECGSDDLLVKIATASLCHSDLMCIDGQMPRTNDDPITIGHEACGTVVAVGDNVQKGRFKVGDPVGFINAYQACWNCKGCESHFVLCTGGKVQMKGFTIDGFFQEYATVDAQTAVVIPENLDLRSAAPVFCAGVTAFQAIQKANLQVGQTFGVIGCGGLGQLAIRYAKSKGYKVIGIDVDDETLATAKSSGADHIFNSRTNKYYVAQLKEVTGGGCHAAAVFSAARAAYESAPQILQIAGTLVCVGIPPGEVSFNMFDITVGKFHIRAAGNSAPLGEITECVDFTTKHGVVSPQRVFELDQINEMIDMVKDGRHGGKRLVVYFS